jgi:hypothetical protein
MESLLRQLNMDGQNDTTILPAMVLIRVIETDDTHVLRNGKEGTTISRAPEDEVTDSVLAVRFIHRSVTN